MNDNVESSHYYSSKEKDVQRLYWSTTTDEITFHIPCKGSTSLGCPISLVWFNRSSHSYKEFLSPIFDEGNIIICILIIPFKDGSNLNRICIEVKKDISIRHILQNCGPLIHDSLVSSGSLAPLLRMTCISISRYLRQILNKKKPAAGRRHAIESLCINYKAKDKTAMDNFYRYLFMDM